MLNSKQAKSFLSNNFEAKEKFAKFVSFRISTNIDPNDVDASWSQLTQSEQNSYIDNATNVISTMINNKQIQYQVEESEYKKFIEAPLAEQTVATVNTNDAGVGQGLSVNSITGSKGYTYNG